MTNEILIKRLENGESISHEDIIRVEAQAKLTELQIEAQKRAAARRTQNESQEAGENATIRILDFDLRAEAVRLASERSRCEREKILAAWKTEDELRDHEWDYCFRGFEAEFHNLCPSVRGFWGASPEEKRIIREDIERTLADLENRGAVLQAIRFNIRGVGNSPIEIRDLPSLQDEPDPPKKAA